MLSSASLFLILAFGGCADPLEKPIGQEAQEHFQRGISGQGELGNIDRSDDPYVKPREGGSAHP